MVTDEKIFGGDAENEEEEGEVDEGIVADEDEPRDFPDHIPGIEKDSSACGDISLFRDFFFAAFSDGYHNVACCGASENIFAGGGCLSGIHQSRRITLFDLSKDIRRSPSSVSQFSSRMRHSGSQERRQRPLAVAVGFKYAEDMYGRPVVITPGNRKMTIRGKRAADSPSSLPAAILKKEDLSQSILFPTERDEKSSQR